MAKSKAIEIVSVKNGRKNISITWIQGDAEFALCENDNPLKAFLDAFESLPPIAATICHLPENYHETGLRVVSFKLGSKGGAQTVALTCAKDLDDASKQFTFTTPERLLEMPTEEGAFSPPLTKAQAALVEEAIEQAKRYVRGDRAQGQIVVPDDDEGDDDADGEGDDNTAPLPLGENDAGKPVKAKGKK